MKEIHFITGHHSAHFKCGRAVLDSDVVIGAGIGYVKGRYLPALLVKW